MAENTQLNRKLKKIKKFLAENSNQLERHLPQLYGFACSSKGLIEDSYREKIWPVLARNLPLAQKYSLAHQGSDFGPERRITEDDEESNDDTRALYSWTFLPTPA